MFFSYSYLLLFSSVPIPPSYLHFSVPIPIPLLILSFSNPSLSPVPFGPVIQSSCYELCWYRVWLGMCPQDSTIRWMEITWCGMWYSQQACLLVSRSSFYCACVLINCNIQYLLDQMLRLIYFMLILCSFYSRVATSRERHLFCSLYPSLTYVEEKRSSIEWLLDR